MERNLLLLIFLGLKLCGAEFIYSAHLSTENHILKYQKFSISPVMTKMENASKDYLCTIDEPIKDMSQYDYLLEHKDKLLECFILKKIKIRNNTTSTLKNIESNTQLFISPTRFKTICDKKKCKIYKLSPST